MGLSAYLATVELADVAHANLHAGLCDRSVTELGVDDLQTALKSADGRLRGQISKRIVVVACLVSLTFFFSSTFFSTGAGAAAATGAGAASPLSSFCFLANFFFWFLDKVELIDSSAAAGAASSAAARFLELCSANIDMACWFGWRIRAGSHDGGGRASGVDGEGSGKIEAGAIAAVERWKISSALVTYPKQNGDKDDTSFSTYALASDFSISSLSSWKRAGSSISSSEPSAMRPDMPSMSESSSSKSEGMSSSFESYSESESE